MHSSMKVIAYILVAGKEGGECSLELNVSYKLKEGWELYGFPIHAGGSYFYQPMVKYQR
jgi:hypothetical protein